MLHTHSHRSHASGYNGRGVSCAQVELGHQHGVAALDQSTCNLLQGLDIDESLGLEQVDEQIRDYLSTKGVRVIELFRQWDDDGTGKIERKEFRRGMKELGLNASDAQLDELFDMWDPDKSGVLTIDELQKLLRRGAAEGEGGAAKPAIEVKHEPNDLINGELTAN